MEPLTIRLHKNDNVVTAKSDIDINIKIENENINTNQHIPVGHKIATKDISEGEEIIKYDNIIGIAKENIKIGNHVHVHNTGMVDKKRDYEFSQGCKNVKVLPKNEQGQVIIFIWASHQLTQECLQEGLPRAIMFFKGHNMTTVSPDLWMRAEYAFQRAPTDMRKGTLLYTKGKGPLSTLGVGDVFSTFRRK